MKALNLTDKAFLVLCKAVRFRYMTWCDLWSMHLTLVMSLFFPEKRSSLQQPPPEPGPRPEPELTEQTRVGIPQPDGSVLFVTPTSSLGSGYLASAPGHGGNLYLAPGVLGGEGDGFSPPPSYDHGASLPPKPQLPEPSRAPERSYSLAAAPNPPQQFYPSFQHQAYQPYQPPPSYPSIQQQPYQPVPGQPPFPQHPYRSYQPVAAQTQHPNQQVPGDFPAVSYQHPPPVQAMVSVDVFHLRHKIGVQPPFLVAETVCVTYS